RTRPRAAESAVNRRVNGASKRRNPPGLGSTGRVFVGTGRTERMTTLHEIETRRHRSRALVPSIEHRSILARDSYLQITRELDARAVETLLWNVVWTLQRANAEPGLLAAVEA